MAANASSKPAIYAALIGNLLVAVTKAAAAAWAGSSAMVSEAIHSFVDTGNELLLLYGLRRASLGADWEHPLGHGRELYFWSFIVALLIFALGATVSVYQGVVYVRHPEPISSPGVSYVVLALSFLFEDSAALLGIAISAVGTFLATRLEAPALDGVASIPIGLVLGGTSILLARESKSLLLGEQANPRLAASILRVTEEVSLVSRANGVLTTQLAPDQVVAALSVEFADELRAPEIEQQVVEIERRVRAAHPEVVTLFIKPQTARTFQATVHWRFGEPAGDPRLGADRRVLPGMRWSACHRRRNRGQLHAGQEHRCLCKRERCAGKPPRSRPGRCRTPGFRDPGAGVPVRTATLLP